MGNNISKAMDKLMHGVYIIGVRTEKSENLMTAAWVSQVAGKPPMISVAIGKTHYTVELIKEAEEFTVSMLKTDQKDIAKICGTQTGRKVNKLNQVSVEFMKDGIPVVKDVAGYLQCRLVDTYEVYDHVLVIGEVLDGMGTDDEVLKYERCDYF